MSPGTLASILWEVPDLCVRRGHSVDVVEQIIRAGLTVVALILIIGLVAALFMIMFSVATGIDDQIQE
jgi:flagellar biosynthesis protein FliQ